MALKKWNVMFTSFVRPKGKQSYCCYNIWNRELGKTSEIKKERKIEIHFRRMVLLHLTYGIAMMRQILSFAYWFSKRTLSKNIHYSGIYVFLFLFNFQVCNFRSKDDEVYVRVLERFFLVWKVLGGREP